MTKEDWLLLPLLAVVLVFVACEQRFPSAPSDSDDDISIIVINNIGGDDNSTKGGGDPDPDPVVNSPPQVRNPGTQNNEAGDEVTLVISVSDPDSDPVTCSLDGAPRGLVMDRDNCIITGTISPSSHEDSPFVSKVTGSDGQALDSEQFIWNVTDPEPDPEPVE